MMNYLRKVAKAELTGSTQVHVEAFVGYPSRT